MSTDYTLAIVSRRATDYQRLIHQARLPGVRLTVCQNRPLSPVQGAQVRVLLADPDLAVASLPACPQLIWLQSTWAGNQPLLAHPRQDYLLTGVKGVFAQAMGEYLFTHLLNDLRPIQHHHALQQQRLWQPTEPGTLAGKTLGIMGMGDIGQGVAKLAQAFNLRVLGFSRSGRACQYAERVYAAKEINDFLAELDYLFCVLPDTPMTQGLLNQQRLAALPAHTLLINAGRGSLLPDADLLHTLDSGHLRGAILDVCEPEPLPVEHPFWRHPRAC